jgi:hypothetical protein
VEAGKLCTFSFQIPHHFSWQGTLTGRFLLYFSVHDNKIDKVAFCCCTNKQRHKFLSYHFLGFYQFSEPSTARWYYISYTKITQKLLYYCIF